MNALKISHHLDNPYEPDNKLRRVLEQDMGFDLSRTDLDELVDQINRGGVIYASYDEFVAAVSSKIAVHETYFLRHHDQFDWIEKVWLPGLLAAQAFNTDKVVRILSAGCSTGEEPYSLYAHLQPILSMMGYRLEVDAVDISENALEVATTGRYGLWSLRGVHSEQEETWLDVRSRNVTVRDWVREGVNFFRHNLTQPFTFDLFQRYDLVLCRNVMIYMHPTAIDAIYCNLTAVLKPGAYLVPGPSDPVPVTAGILELEWESGVRLYRKKPEFMSVAKIIDAEISPVFDDEKKSTGAVKPLKVNPVIVADTASLRASSTSLEKIEALICQCEYDQARHLLEQNIAHDPLDVKSLIMLAMLAMDLDEIDLAAMVTRKAMYLKPKSPYVIYLSANIKYYRKDMAGAMKYLQWALDELNEYHPGDPVEFFDGMKVEQLKGVIHARLAAMSR